MEQGLGKHEVAVPLDSTAVHGVIPVAARLLASECVARTSASEMLCEVSRVILESQPWTFQNGGLLENQMLAGASPLSLPWDVATRMSSESRPSSCTGFTSDAALFVAS